MPLPLPRLALPKSVEIRNNQLKCVYFVLVAAFWAGMAIRFVLAKQMYQRISVGQFVSPVAWAGGIGNHEEMSRVVNTFLASDYCTDPERYAYQWDEAGDWIFSGYRCLPLCDGSTGALNHSQDTFRTCFHGQEAYRKESRSQIILLTELEETIHEPVQTNVGDGSGGSDDNATNLGPSGPGSGSTKFFFMPTVDALSLSFTYELTVPMGNPLGAIRRGSSDVIKKDSVEDILTVILDSEGEISRIVPPSFSIDVTLIELFALAGGGDLLDGINTLAGPNKLEGPNKLSGVVSRISGAEVVLGLDCYNQHQRFLGGEYDSWTDPVCYVSARASRTAWVSGESLTSLGTGDRTLHQFYHGIRVRFEESGSFFAVSPDSMLAALIDAVVLIGIPKRIILFFMITCLGTLSNIYKRVLFEPFDIMEQLGGMAARIAASSASFVELEDNDADRGITLNRMVERLHETLGFEEKKIDRNELKQFVDVCFNSIIATFDLHIDGPDGTPVVKQEHEVMKVLSDFGVMCDVSSQTQRRERDYHKRRITLETFSNAIASNAPLEFEAAMDLFDADRRIGLAELWFTPKQIRKHVRHKNMGAPADDVEEPAAESAAPAASAPPPKCPTALEKVLEASDAASSHRETLETPSVLTAHGEGSGHDCLRALECLRSAGTHQTLEERRKSLQELNEVVVKMLQREQLLTHREEVVAQRLDESDLRMQALVDSVAKLSLQKEGSEAGPEPSPIGGVSARVLERLDELSTKVRDLEALSFHIAHPAEDTSMAPAHATPLPPDGEAPLKDTRVSADSHQISNGTGIEAGTVHPPWASPPSQWNLEPKGSSPPPKGSSAPPAMERKNSEEPTPLVSPHDGDLGVLLRTTGCMQEQISKLEVTTLDASLRAVKAIEELGPPLQRRIEALERRAAEDLSAAVASGDAAEKTPPPSPFDLRPACTTRQSAAATPRSARGICSLIGP